MLTKILELLSFIAEFTQSVVLSLTYQ